MRSSGPRADRTNALGVLARTSGLAWSQGRSVRADSGACYGPGGLPALSSVLKVTTSRQYSRSIGRSTTYQVSAAPTPPPDSIRVIMSSAAVPPIGYQLPSLGLDALRYGSLVFIRPTDLDATDHLGRRLVALPRLRTIPYRPEIRGALPHLLLGSDDGGPALSRPGRPASWLVRGLRTRAGDGMRVVQERDLLAPPRDLEKVVAHLLFFAHRAVPSVVGIVSEPDDTLAYLVQSATPRIGALAALVGRSFPPPRSRSSGATPSTFATCSQRSRLMFSGCFSILM